MARSQTQQMILVLVETIVLRANEEQEVLCSIVNYTYWGLLVGGKVASI